MLSDCGPSQALHDLVPRRAPTHHTHVRARAHRDMSIISAKQRAFEEAVVHNQIFFDAVVHSQRESAAHPLPPPPDRSLEFVANMHKHAPTTAPRHFSKAKSTLHQLVREWGAEGAGERASCYGVLLKALQRFLPVTPENL